MKRTCWLIPVIWVSLGFLGCPADDTGEAIWLANLANPFLGKWESDIPSAEATIRFEFKQNGTFTCEFPVGPDPDDTMTATGGYLVKDNVQVTFMSFDEGIGGYTFTAADNNTINVTEIEEVKDGTVVSGNTAPFTRVSGSAVNKDDKSFVLSNTLIGGKWTANGTVYQFRDDGTATMTAGNQSSEIAYFAFYDQGIETDVLVTFIPTTKAFTAYAFTAPKTSNAPTTTMKEITEVTMSEQGELSATYGEAVIFTHSN
ncbi:MAG: hypothetical protein LBC51_00960 [Treponema sp.]|jgi:hypothetical protein|nr:hypothetical protein [Treponema sp.]